MKHEVQGARRPRPDDREQKNREHAKNILGSARPMKPAPEIKVPSNSLAISKKAEVEEETGSICPSFGGKKAPEL